MKVKTESEVAQSCPTPSDPMDCSLPGSSIHGICQARVLEWGAIAFSDSRPRSLQRQKKKKKVEEIYNPELTWTKEVTNLEEPEVLSEKKTPEMTTEYWLYSHVVYTSL